MTNLKPSYFSSLLPELSTRASRAAVSRLGFSNPALREYLINVFNQDFGKNGAFLGDPVFEATFGWTPAEKTMHQLSGVLLEPALVDAMDAPKGDKKNSYRFPKNIAPYKHQLDAWQHLIRQEPQSVVVTSGTGSGKTECFMIPILNQLIKEHANTKSKLVGVRALFLYPLNALIASQQERLDAWTYSFGDTIRFCLYNGLTPDVVPEHRRRESPNHVLDRQVLRAVPPPLLVTNATMLEYMLVRAQDAPILEESQGKLQWIVLDEAHTYIGSQAAELALLLRRVLHAFGVSSDKVRFIATSATIGGEDAALKLKKFLASLAGVEEDKVHVVSGVRMIPKLPEVNGRFSDALIDQLFDNQILQENTTYDLLSVNRTARKIRELFIPPAGFPAQQLSTIESAIGVNNDINRHDTALRWLDLLTSAKSEDGAPFLPLRLHAFQNVVSGIWACADVSCRLRHGSALDSNVWPYGAIYLEQRRHCDCGSPVFELRSCNECNAVFLWARQQIKSDGRYYLVHDQEMEVDEFSLDTEVAEDDIIEEVISNNHILIANDYPSETSELLLDRKTLQLYPSNISNTVRIRAKEADESDLAIIICPSCQSRKGKGLYRPAILGAPFLLGVVVPTLLEFCPDIDTGEDKPKDRPYRGRRMITFSDSRQGTARMAVKLQQESERNRVRGLIYKRIITQGVTTSTHQQQSLENELAILRPLVNTNIEIKNLVDQKEQELIALLKPKPIVFEDMARWLAETEIDIKDRIADYYKSMDRQLFAEQDGILELSRILIAREFARRPRRLNSLETMGLVSVFYPKLEKIKELPSRPGITSYFGKIDEWRTFLKICLDFYVREGIFIRLPDAWQKWGGNRVTAKQLIRYDSNEDATTKIKIWPQVKNRKNQQRLVRLLSAAFQINSESDIGREKIDGILQEAWNSLVSVGLLSASGEARFLDLRDIALGLPEKTYVCPVTRRILDVTLNGITPYIPNSATVLDPFRCNTIKVPKCEIINQDFPSEDIRLEKIREWLNHNQDIQSLRNEGLWSDISDRIIEGAFYYRAVEHSAQQPGIRLKKYENEFKSGRINLMSCSTTMEMGVDIGGISIVAMNNVPPHPANYLQRAGRAGRRAETRSVALTVCKNNPHDQYVLKNTLWPFVTKLPAPVIRLSSQVIVQRHVNSMLLSTFLRQKVNARGDLNKLNVGWWMLPDNQSPAEEFMAWVRCYESVNDQYPTNGLKQLLRYTCLDGISNLKKVAAEAANMMNELRLKWLTEYRSISEQLSLFNMPNVDKVPAYKALKIQEDRLLREYLLRELASKGFLPGYGFPTAITSFETLTLDEVKKIKLESKEGERVDNMLRRRELPNRDCATALREYAPGAEVVIDGLVYRSAGITLNWHSPAAVQQVKEIQNIRSIWRCRSCGSSGSVIDLTALTNCPDCGVDFVEDEKNLVTFQYLEPSGFSVDLFESPHNDVTHQIFIPVESPWINAYGDWLPLANPRLGFFRYSPLGTVFNFSAGPAKLGYAVCLSCGKAEAMTSEGEMPKVFQREHKRLRGGQGVADVICDGSHKPFSIKLNLRLGYESRTDVLEILLKYEDGTALQDKITAYSLAVALRSAIASNLGIEVSELGCDIKPVRLGDALNGYAIVIYDQNSSGYASSLADIIPNLLRDARKKLDCPSNCDTACQSCLLHYDTRFRVDELNRHEALRFLTNEFLEKLVLPDDLQLFGKGLSQAEHHLLHESVTQELAVPNVQELRVYLSDDIDKWDIASSPLRHWIHVWSASENKVKLILPTNDLNRLTKNDRFMLEVLSNMTNVTLWYGIPLSLKSIGVISVEVVHKDGVVCWASQDIGISIPDSGWGESSSLLVRSSRLSSGGILHKLIKLDVQTPLESTSVLHKLEVSNQLDGLGNKFGLELLRLLEKSVGGELLKDDPIIRIKYQDRYLNAPMPCALLLDFLNALKNDYSDEWEVSNIIIKLSPIPEPKTQKKPSQLNHNWETDADRQAALIEAFDYCGMEINLQQGDKHDSIHARVMELFLRSGQCWRIWFDQGFSYWKHPSQTNLRSRGAIDRFPFQSNAKHQGESLAQINFLIEGQCFPTFIFIEKDL